MCQVFPKYISRGLFPELSQSAPNLGLMVTVALTPPPPPGTACVLILRSQEASFYPLNFEKLMCEIAGLAELC